MRVIASMLLLVQSSFVTAKPRVHSTATTLDFHAPADFRFYFTDSGASMRLSDLEAVEDTVAGMVAGAQARVLGSCGTAAAINSIGPDGNVNCTNTISQDVIDRLNGDMQQMQSSLPRPCLFSPWGNWSDCTDECGAKQRRTRTILRAASASSVSCTEFPLFEERDCPGVCDPRDPDFCNGNERWYYLNSGATTVDIGSYANQKVIFHRPAASPSEGSLPFGKRVARMTTGSTRTFGTNQIGSVDGFRTGDYLCGTVGGIEVSGRDSSGNSIRSWVPSRLAGTLFVVPVVRSNPQIIYVAALSRPAQVTLFAGSQDLDELYLPARGAYSFLVGRAGQSIRIVSTASILVSYAAGARSSIGQGTATPPTSGTADYMPLSPASPAMVGKSSRAYVGANRAGQIRIACSQANFSGTGNLQGTGRFIRFGQFSANYSGPACRAFSQNGALVGTVSVSDGAGDAATSWMSPGTMRKQFLIQAPISYLSLVCAGPGQATLQYPRGQTGGQRVLQVVGTGAASGAWTNEPRFMRTGTWITTTSFCYIVVDSVPSYDERIIFGA